MNDLISRQAAIDALARMMPRSYTPDGSHPADEEIFRAQEVFADCIEALEILPSAQPATNCSEFPNNSDTISRQAAITQLSHNKNKGDDEWELAVENDIQTIWKLPPAQPEIIRCRNCKFASGDSRICMKFGHSPIGELDFCAWAERRTDE